MPELPEVETVVRGLRKHLLGATFRDLLHLDPRSLRTPRAVAAASRSLCGRRVEMISRLGKFIRIHLDDKALLTVHLGMTGRLLVLDVGRQVADHTHLRVRLGRDELRFVNPRWCMGGLWMLGGEGGEGSSADPCARLGPDPLAVSPEAFERLLDRRRQAKALLLDQAALAGVGNIYADESLFAAGIHPRARTDQLSRPRRRRLLASLQDRLRESIARGGSTLRDYRNVDGDVGWFQLSLQVYGRPGAPCPTCGKPISHATVAGRSTHYCTNCQRF